MKTFYDVLNIPEGASVEEIENAYKELKNRYSAYLSDPLNNEKAKEKIKKIGIAFQILSNPEKRASYDKDLANMRADQLMNNLQKNTNTHNEQLRKQEEIRIQQEALAKAEKEKLLAEKLKKERDEKLKFIQDEINKQIEEQQKQHEIKVKEANQKLDLDTQIKEHKKQQKLENKIRKKLEEQKMAEYRSYLRKMGVSVKEPFSIKTVIRTVIATIIVLGMVFFIIQIPIVKNTILGNEVIQSFLNIFK